MTQNSEKSLTKEASDFAYKLKYEHLTNNALNITRRCILDGISVMIGGTEQDALDVMYRYIKSTDGSPQSRLIGVKDKKYPAHLSALWHGLAGHAMDWDDTQLSVGPGRMYGLLTHPTVPPLSACLSLAETLTNVSGEKFSGKTHLANIFKSKTSAFFLNENQINDEALKKIKLYESIIVDGFTNTIDERLIYSILNLVDQDSKYLLINSETPLGEINFKLPDLASRSKNLLHAKIESPDDDLIFAIILKNFSDRQIKLEKKIIEFIINRIDRSYSKISEFIYKIDEFSLKKKKPINLKTIKEIL